MRQVDEIEVDVATRLTQTFTLDLPDGRVGGRPVAEHVTLTKGRNVKLTISEACINAPTPSYKLVTLLAEAFHITDPKHFPLLHLALSDESPVTILAAFLQHGIAVEGLTMGNAMLHLPG